MIILIKLVRMHRVMIFKQQKNILKYQLVLLTGLDSNFNKILRLQQEKNPIENFEIFQGVSADWLVQILRIVSLLLI